MKENFDPARRGESGERASPTTGTATATPTGATTSASYSYLSNPKVNFGSEVPHTLNSDATRLNAPSSATTTNRNDSTSMLERIAFPYKLLRKYIASLPDTFYGSQTVDKRDVGTVVQTMSLFLNGQDVSEENGDAPFKNFMDVPSSLEPLKVLNGARPAPRQAASQLCENPAADKVGVHKVPPIIEMLYPQVPTGAERKTYDGATAKTTLEDEHESTPPTMTARTDADDAWATPPGRSLAGSAKSTDLFEAISKHVLSIASPGQSYDGKQNALPRFRNQTSPMFTDSMFLRGRQGSGGPTTPIDNSLTLSSEETLTLEQLDNGTPSDLSSFDTNLSEQYNTHPKVIDNVKNVGDDRVLGMDTKSITVMELPNQLSLYNIFSKQYLSGRKKHSFVSTDLKARTSGDSSCSINQHEPSDIDEQEVAPTSGGDDVHSNDSSCITLLNKRVHGHTVDEKPKDVNTEPGLVEENERSLPMKLSAQMSLYNLFDEEYLSGKKKHSFNSSSASNRHTSEDDTNVSGLENSDGGMQKITDKSSRHERKGETLSVLELRSLMSKNGLLEEKNCNKKKKTKAQPLEPNRINFDDSIQEFTMESDQKFKAKTLSVQNVHSKMSVPCLDDNTVNGKGKTKAQSSESIRMNFDDSVQGVISKSGHGQAGESSSVQELRSLMSKHGLLNDKNAHGKLNTKAQPSSSIRINFDDSIEQVNSTSDAHGCKVQDFLSHMPVLGVLNEKNTSGENTQSPSETSNKHNNIASKESTPTIVLYREESFVSHPNKPSQKTKEIRDTRGNTSEGLTNQREDSITVGITEPDSSEGNMPLKRIPDGVMRDTSVQQKDKTVKIDSMSTSENNSYDSNCESDDIPKTISNYFDDEKMLCEGRKSLRDLHGSMINTQIMPISDSSWSKLPMALYRSTSEVDDVAYATSADSIDDSESRRERRQSRERRRSSGRGGPPGEEDSLETPSASFESGEEATPEDSMDESGSGSEDSPKSDSLTNWSPISFGSSTSESVVPGEPALGPGFSPKASYPMNWSKLPGASLGTTVPVDNARKPGNPLDDDEFESTFKFSQLQFPTDDPVWEQRETSEASLPSGSEPRADARTMDDWDASMMKFLTTGSIKSSSDIDEKLSEVHGNSKTGFNRYENSNEENLNLGMKGSGQMPKPREMLSIYSRGVTNDPPSATNAKSSPSLNMKIKPALRKNSDARNKHNNNEEDVCLAAKAAPSSSNRSFGRSVSFSEKRTEFPWRGTEAVSTPMAVTPAKVETDSPMADKDHGGRSEEDPTSGPDQSGARTPPTADNADKKDGHAQRENEPKKDASKQQVAAGGKRRSSSVDGSGKRAKSRQRVQDEEPKRSNSDDANQTSLFSLDNIMPYMRMLFTPVMDEVALDTLHVLRGDPGCELCSQRHQEDETEARVVPRQEGGESGDEERPRENDENAHKQPAKQEGDRRESHGKEEKREEEEERRRSSHKDKEETEEDGEDKMRRSSHKDREEKGEGEDKSRRSSSKDHEEKKEAEDDKIHQEEAEEKKKHADETKGVEEESKEK